MVARTPWTTSAFATVLGLAAVAVGATVGFIIDGGASVSAWLLTTLVALAWSGARLAVILIINHRVDKTVRDRLVYTWGLTLTPYVAAVGVIPHLGVWAISLLLMMHLLEQASLPGVGARRTVAWVAGFETAAAAAVWISTNLSVLLVVD